MKNIELFYPGYTKKAVTFSIDDGHVQYDGKLLDIVRPVGIKGTFNLTSADRITPAEYLELYRGYEIANHCKHHPHAFDDSVNYIIADEPFEPETADNSLLYRHPSLKGFYYISRPRGWRLITDAETYIECIKAAERELEAVFGVGSVRSFAWPFHEQNSEAIKTYLAACGYYAVRQSGLVFDTTGFDFPESSIGWKCNANHQNLMDMAALYEAYPDDGKLKFFSFGVHSADFERAERWDELKAFAARYANRPSDFFYATVGEIFDYHKAVGMLEISDKTIFNPSGLTVYVKLDGTPIAVPPHGEILLS